MPTKSTGRAASVARNNERKAKLKAGGVQTTVANKPSPQPTVAGVSTTGGGSARGDDFSGSFNTSGGAASVAKEKIDPTPRTKEQLKKATFGLAGDGLSESASRLVEAQRLQQERKDRREARLRRSKDGKMASDSLRASEMGLTEDEAITTKGAKSSISGRDERQRTGAGTIDNPLTDIQIEDLASQGIKEGDMVPGKGYLSPLGTFYTKKAEEMTAKAEKLKEKDKSAADSIITSDASAVQTESQATEDIKTASMVQRDLTYIDDEIDRLQTSLKDEMDSINAQFKVDKKALESKQQGEVGQTSVQLANAGGYLGMSGSATGVLLNLAKGHKAELQSLDARRQQAIFEAQDAVRKSRFDLVKLKAQELADIEQEEYERKQDYLKSVQETNAKEAEKKAKIQTQNDIYNAIAKGSKTPEAIFNALGGEVDIAEISKFLDGIDAGDETSFKFSATQNASLLGSGMSMDDITALKEYVNENGYDEKVKSLLTSTQRMAVDKIFLPKPVAIGSGASANKYQAKIKGDTINKLSGLGYKPEDIENIEYVLNNYGIESVLYGEDDPDKRAELATILDAETALSGVESELNPPSVDTVITDIISTMSDEQTTKLKEMADQADISSIWKGKKTDIENLLKTPEIQGQLQILIDQGATTEEILQALTQ